jgi:hypothetical protein
MARASTRGPGGEKIPEFSPIFPELKVATIAKLEVHLQYETREGDVQWAEVLGLPVYASWEDIQRKAGGGFYKVAAKGPGKTGFLDNDQKRLDGPPKFLKRIREREAAEREDAPGDEADELDEIRTEIRAIVRQQAEILPEAIKATTTALVQATDSAASRGVAMAERMAAMVSLHATQLDTMMKAHTAETDRYRTRVAELEKQVETLTLQNAGYLKQQAQAAGARGWIRDLKELSPELPKITGVLERAGKAWRGELKPGAPDPKQLEGASGAAPASANGAAAPAAKRDPFGD